MPLPRRRVMDAFPVKTDGEMYFVLRDAEGILDDPVVVDPLSFLVWNLLNGYSDVEALQERIAPYAGGMKIPEGRLRSVVDQLDRHLLLESPALEARREELARAFRAAAARPARFAGRGGYAETEAELRRELDAYYEHEFGAGRPEYTRRHPPPQGVLAPHIDFRRGGTCYTHAYRAVAESQPAETYVILGVAHVSPPKPFVLTTKSYETPLGTAESDLEFIRELLSRTGSDAGLLDHEMVHRNEHSIEFQAVFLKHAHPEAAFRIVPILCSSFEPHLKAGAPSDAALIESTIEALRETILNVGRRVTIIAGVDLSHVGPRFGDDTPLDQRLVEWMSEGDRRSLEYVANADADGFWNSVMADGNRRHVCGLTAGYTALRLLGGSRGALLRYGFAPDPAGGLVSFASAVFR
ncbi:MAG: AmmeMemoRadiSam system protein B [Planctomycetes bacterium]|nr:AmmeMemoRadiSam system protein B [Planctomycetota bacterium]